MVHRLVFRRLHSSPKFGEVRRFLRIIGVEFTSIVSLIRVANCDSREIGGRAVREWGFCCSFLRLYGTVPTICDILMQF